MNYEALGWADAERARAFNPDAPPVRDDLDEFMRQDLRGIPLPIKAPSLPQRDKVD